MGKQKNYIYTQLDSEPTLILTIGDVAYEVTQYNDSWAVNEIPVAQLAIAVGRNARSTGAAQKAAVHLNNQHRQMTKAKVTLKIAGEYDADNKVWPEAATTIFEGYFLGFIPRKIRGKYQVVANLAHWSIDLTCSSCLTADGHFTNPTQLNVAAILPTRSQNFNMGAYEHIGKGAAIAESVVQDGLWDAIKALFCDLANSATLAMSPNGLCGGAGNARTNVRALEALRRFEGAGGACAYYDGGGKTYAVPLRLKSASVLMSRNVVDALAHELLGHYANITFWDKLIGQFCPAFCMAVVPMVDRCLVVADTPGYRGGYWKTVTPNEYDSLDMSPVLEQPLRAIGVTSEFLTETQATERRQKSVTIGGCYIEESIDAQDGVIRIVPPPRWLCNSYTTIEGYGGPDGTRDNEAGRFVGCDKVGPRVSDVFSSDDVELFKDYAKMVYANSMIRGRTGQLSGRLRFDIAPNSLIRLVQNGEAMMDGEDQLAVTSIACVSRVNTSISAEGPRAGTTLQLSHLRRENPENQEDRTSVKEHPLFGTAIHGGGKHGSPLVPTYDL